MRTRETPDSPGEIVDAGLLQRRDYIRTSVQSFPAGLLRELFQAMEACRHPRRVASAKPPRIPDMSISEMQREIIWRLQTLPPDDTGTIAALVQRLLERLQ